MTIQRPLKILVFGTGAVGSTLGWRLARNSHVKLSVVCRSNYEAVKQQGIQLNTKMWGNGQCTPHRVIRSTREVAGASFDYVVCANKINPAEGLSFIKEIEGVVSANTAIVSAQNGVGVEGPLRRAFRNNPILSAICYISCLQPAPGFVQQVSNVRPHAFHIGVHDPRGFEAAELEHMKLKEFVALDDRFKQIDDAQAERWTKQIFNGAWNPTTAISGLETHPLLGSPYLQTVRQLAHEIYSVAIKLGVSLSEDIPAQTIEFARDNPSLAPSMLQDARKKRPMEVESLCGDISRIADQVGVPVPTVKLVYHTLLEMNRRILAPPKLPLGARKEHVVERSRSVPQDLRVQSSAEVVVAAA